MPRRVRDNADMSGARATASPKALPRGQWLAYEQPLSERVRTFLRLEHLFDQLLHHAAGRAAWDSRAALLTLLEIQSLLGKGDIRSETLKEMERQTQLLLRLRSRQEVDAARLDNILDTLGRLRGRLEGQMQQPGRELRDSEFLAALKNRASIPGGACGFDLPGLQQWLNLPAEDRGRDIRHWIDSLDPLSRGLRLVLMLIRESTTPVAETAAGGLYQMTLDSSHTCLLIRVLLPADSVLYPEISGSRHRFAIRFLHREGVMSRPRQATEDVRFRLACCQL